MTANLAIALAIPLSNNSKPPKRSFGQAMLLAWIGLLPFAVVAVAASGDRGGNLEEKNVVKFDPSFERSLVSVHQNHY